MNSQNLSLGSPNLEEAIDYHPLITEPETLLTEVVLLMNQRQEFQCLLPDWRQDSQSTINQQNNSNCVLIVEDQKIVGIFTQRDLVRLIAKNFDFHGVAISEVMTSEIITLSKKHFQDVFAALFLFRRYRIRHLPIVDELGNLVGVVSHESLRACLRPSNLLKLRRVADIMTSNVIQANPSASVLNLVRLMADYRVSCVVIVDHLVQKSNGGLPVGIITEKDILQFKGLRLNLDKTQAQDVMSTPLFLLNPDDSLWYAHQQMQKMRLRRLVVSWNWGEGLGIVTQTSLLKVFDPMEMYGVIDTLQQTVKNLENKIDHKSVSIKQISKLISENSSDRIKDQIPNIKEDNQENISKILFHLEQTTKQLINNDRLSEEEKMSYLNENLMRINQLQKFIIN